MSCGCHPNPCTCCTPTVESVEYTFENANANGIGVFDNETDNLVQFRGVVSANVSLTVTLNATDNTIVLAFDPDALVADIPTATTAQRGIAETATNAEALAKAATDKILTPSNLAALGSTTTFAGLAEFATEAETIAGVSSTLAVTPAGLAATGATFGTTTWADAVARGAKVPSFVGQFGTQLDTDQPYVAYGPSAGNWNPIFVGGISNTVTSGTDFNLASFGMSFTGGDMFFETDDISFTDCILDFTTSTIWQVGGATLPNSSFIWVAADGTTSVFLMADVLSTENTNTGWANFSNSTVRKTGDCNTLTLPQLCQIVDTLIQTLGVAKQLPIP